MYINKNGAVSLFLISRPAPLIFAALYSDRFNLERVKTTTPDDFLDRVLGTIERENISPDNVIIQLPSVFAENEGRQILKEFVKKVPGIRFMVIDTTDLKLESSSDRANYRLNIYSTLLLARQINEDTRRDSKIYQLLQFMMMSMTGDKENRVFDALIDSVRFVDIYGIFNNILSYKPVGKLDAPDPAIVSAALMSA